MKDISLMKYRGKNPVPITPSDSLVSSLKSSHIYIYIYNLCVCVCDGRWVPKIYRIFKPPLQFGINFQVNFCEMPPPKLKCCTLARNVMPLNSSLQEGLASRRSVLDILMNQTHSLLLNFLLSSAGYSLDFQS